MQQELEPNEELDLWDVFLRNAQKKADEKARRLRDLEEAYEEAKRRKAEADTRAAEAERTQLQMTRQSLRVILKSRFDYDLPTTLSDKVDYETAHQAVQLAAICSTLHEFLQKFDAIKTEREPS